MRLDTTIFKQIEFHLYNYNKEKLIEKQNIYEKINISNLAFSGSKSFKSDQTFNKTVKLEKLNEQEKWDKIIDKTIEIYKGTDKENFINYKYFKKYSEVKLCQELCIEKTTLYQWRKDILYLILVLAIQEQLIHIDF